MSNYIHHSIGDDAAITSVPNGFEQATSIDTLVAGVHFPLTSSAADIGHKALAVSLSDMAAMGATPTTTLLSLTLPQADEGWLNHFATHFFRLADQFDVILVGGDTCQGPLSISTVVNGILPKGQALTRSGAKEGDTLYVTGTLGDAGMGLRQLERQDVQRADPFLLERLNRPTPRVAWGQALRSIASAVIDVSDGLAADIDKIIHASHVGANVQLSTLPLSPPLKKACHLSSARTLALTSGDDYELCFTVPQTQIDTLHSLQNRFDCPITAIGTITASRQLVITDDNQQKVPLTQRGHEHF